MSVSLVLNTRTRVNTNETNKFDFGQAEDLYFKLYATLKNQDTSIMKSTIYWEVELAGKSGYIIDNNSNNTVTLFSNDSGVIYTNNKHKFGRIDRGTVIFTYTQEITQQAGEIYTIEQVGFDASFSAWGNKHIYTITSDVILPMIASYSTMSFDTGYDDSHRINVNSDVTITLTNPASTTHTLYYSKNNESTWTQFSLTNGKWTVPISLLNSYTKVKTFELYIKAVNSFGLSTYKYLYVNIPSTYGVKLSNETYNTSNYIENKYVYGYSSLKASANASFETSTGATITDFYITEQYGSIQNKYNLTSGVLQDLNPPTGYTTTYSFYAKDSRGFEVTSSTYSITPYRYNGKKLLNLTATRTNQSTVNYSFEYVFDSNFATDSYTKYNVTLSRKGGNIIKELNNINITTSSTNYTGTISTTLTGFTLTQGYDYTLTIRLIDSYDSSTVQSVDLLGSDGTLLSLHENGDGITIGRDATDSGFNSYLDSTFYGNLKKNVNGTLQNVSVEGHTHNSSDISNLGSLASLNSIDYNSDKLTNKPTIPSVNNGSLTIQRNGADLGRFYANQPDDGTINIIVPTTLPAYTKILWERSGEWNTSFSAQSITLNTNISNFKMIEIFYLGGTDATLYMTSSRLYNDYSAGSSTTGLLLLGTGSGKVTSRLVSDINGTNITFGDGRIQKFTTTYRNSVYTTDASNTPDNDRCIPVMVVGWY